MGVDLSQSRSCGSDGDERFRLLFEGLNQGVTFQDAEGYILDANPAAERILGVTRAELIGRHARDSSWQVCDASGSAISEKNYPGFVARAMDQAQIKVTVGIFNSARGERRWLNVDYIPQPSLPGRPSVSLCTVFSDITEQRRTEQALRENENYLGRAQRIASVGSCFLDFRDDKLKWSDEVFSIYGVEKSQHVPSLDSVRKLIHPDDWQIYIDAVETAREGHQPHPIQYRIFRPDGQIRILFRDSELSLDDAGVVIGALSIIQDITDLRAAEKQKDELQTQLFHAQRLEALGTLAGGIAHDLNNTLVPILGLSEAMLSGVRANHPHRPLLQVIHTAGTRARDLVRRILTFSRREDLDSKPLELTPFLHETMRLVRAGLPANIKIDQRISRPFRIFGDASQLHQVIVNLVTNAAHAIGDVGGKITVRVSESRATRLDDRSSLAGKFIRISVIDAGCGMDDETRKHIFEPFFTTKKIGAGTGLGLSVVHGIVTAHGGHIDVTSSLGEGSRFDVFLPMLAPERDVNEIAGIAS
jgi:PAS domain S-box-containing protein